MNTSTALIYGAATVLTVGTAYAIYFDYKRHNDPEFRKALKRDKKRLIKEQKQQADADNEAQRRGLKQAVKEAQEEGFPTDVEEKEAFFMNEVARGETLCQDGGQAVEAALCFYRALKVYPQPRDLISIYDKTVPKNVLDLLAEMIAADGEIGVGVGPSEPTLGVE